MKTMEKVDLEQMKLVDIRTVNRESLADIKNIGIDGKAPIEQRFAGLTPIGRINNMDADKLREVLGDGDIVVTLSLER